MSETASRWSRLRYLLAIPVVLAIPVIALVARGMGPAPVPPTDGPRVVQFATPVANSYAIVGESGVVLVDAQEADFEDFIVESLAAENIDRGDVKAILLTHGHADHAGSVAALATALEVPAYVGQGDVSMVTAGQNRELPSMSLIASLLKRMLGGAYPPYADVKGVAGSMDLSSMGVDGIARVGAGHTDGAMLIELGNGVAVVGDLIRGEMLAPYEAEMHFFHEHCPTSHAQLQLLLDNGTTLFYVGHGGPLTAETVKGYLASVECP